MPSSSGSTGSRIRGGDWRRGARGNDPPPGSSPQPALSAPIRRPSGSRSSACGLCGRAAAGARAGRRSRRCRARRGKEPTWCRRSSRRSKRWPPSAKSRTPCARSSANIGNGDDMSIGHGAGTAPTMDQLRPSSVGLRADHGLRSGGRTGRGRRRGELRHPGRRDAGPGRRVGQRQIGHRAVDHAPGAAARANRGRTRHLQRPRFVHAAGSGHAGGARRARSR